MSDAPSPCAYEDRCTTGCHDPDAATPPTTHGRRCDWRALCAIAGSVIFAAFRLDHGDLPAADMQAYVLVSALIVLVD